MAKYDTISKHFIQTYPQDFIQLSLQRDAIKVLDILDTEQPTTKTHHMDSLIKVMIAGEEALVHHEFQTTTDPTMPIRMAGYIIRAIERHNLPIYSRVIYLRPNAGKNDPGYYIQDLPGHKIEIQYRVIRLSEIEGQRILDEGHAGLFPFTPLMKPPEGTSSEAWLHQCVDVTNALPLEESIKVDILNGLTILSGLGYESDTINRIIIQEGLMDAIMRESSFAQYIMKQAREEGIEQGEIKSTLAGIREVLEIRFGLSEAHPISDRLAAVEDLQHLKQLHRLSVQVSSLEAFQQALDR